VTRFVVETATSELHVGDRIISCVIGRGGACEAGDKREGDGRTPLGDWPIRAVLLRPDRDLSPPAAMPWRWLRPGDGWSDDPGDPAYNRPVRHPHAFSAERMWREDSLYDAVIVLGHNDRPPVAGLGSAIFLHIRGDAPTEGCIAISRNDIPVVLAALVPEAFITIR
jgi:L,D-peptidoglycan transpeptidase YkuD (ErfK/YbiS/YcfS/YnhG family)